MKCSTDIPMGRMVATGMITEGHESTGRRGASRATDGVARDHFFFSSVPCRVRPAIVLI
jgi:hypothetical protein